MEKSLTEFLNAYNKDKADYIKKWLVSWDYQLRRIRAHKKYEAEITSDFFDYTGKEDLIKWMNWFGRDPYGNYLNAQKIDELIAQSLLNEKKVFTKLGLDFNFPAYNETIAINNAQDFFIPQMYPAPDRNRINTVVDFGAGYGRQASLWATPDKTYIGVDAIPNSYCLQNLYYHALCANVKDYAEDTAKFNINVKEHGIYHLPTWRMDLIPSGSCDLIICIQVLGELNTKLIKWAVSHFHRILKPGGMFYIRDCGQSAKMATRLDYDKYIASHGFSLEFKPHVIDKVDIHGIPRIYRRNDNAVLKTQSKSAKQRTREWVSELDYLTGGALRKIRKLLR